MTFGCFRPRDFVLPDGKRRAETLMLMLMLKQFNT